LNKGGNWVGFDADEGEERKKKVNSRDLDFKGIFGRILLQ